ncbi:MAG: hypothetical protein IV100_24390 [Myxococcales bacterium]|nr:hypothetical protein [Myxococcales bacterium]
MAFCGMRRAGKTTTLKQIVLDVIVVDTARGRESLAFGEIERVFLVE